MGELRVGLAAVEHLHALLRVVVLLSQALALLADGGEVRPTAGQDDGTHRPHQVVAPRVGLRVAGRIGYPHLGVGVGGQHGDVGHHAAHLEVHVVQLHVLPADVRPPEQAARHRSGDDGAGQSAAHVGLREGFAVEEAELENLPEVLVGLHHVGRQLGTGGQRNAHLAGFRRQGDSLGRSQRLETFAPGLHRHARVGGAAAQVALGTIGHVGHVERAAAVHFRLAVRRPHAQGDDDDHDHANGQRRAQHGDPADDGVLAQVVNGLLNIESYHVQRVING